MKKIILITSICFHFLSFSKEEVILYTYHYKAPFIVSLESKKGLSYEMTTLMNKYSKKYNYRLNYVPRKRLNLISEKKIVLWSNPAWEKDKARTKYLWSRDLFKDSDVIISNKNYKNKVVKVVGVGGYFYPELNEYLQRNNLKRFNVKAENQVLSMISKNRAELGIMSYSALMYHFTKDQELKSIINISNELQADYYRTFYFSKDYLDQFDDFQNLFKNSEFKMELDVLLRKFGLGLEK